MMFHSWDTSWLIAFSFFASDMKRIKDIHSDNFYVSFGIDGVYNSVIYGLIYNRAFPNYSYNWWDADSPDDTLKIYRAAREIFKMNKDEIQSMAILERLV